MCGNEIALSGCVHVSRFVSEVKSIVTRPPCFQVNFLKAKSLKRPNNFRVFMSKYPSLPCIRVVEANAGIIDLVDDDNDVFIPSFNADEVKATK